ncbi:hypothetical protein PR048_013910 [Dryococelus australis]|uniref:HAT C-terminal dimerisation domain-containing protein n=1 Tax=Dryococelus australis TaxID=614101 RepID=A0ABQ9HU04_9NEOP|nr:hypothetical protein PR048_013910 [Dryococelus australis]
MPQRLLPNDWELISDYVEVLQPLDEATRDVSTDNVPTASLVIPILYGLASFLQDYVNGQCSQRMPKMFAKYLIAAINTRFPMFEYMVPHCYCTVMYPRFKDGVLSQSRKEIVIKNVTKDLESAEKTSTKSFIRKTYRMSGNMFSTSPCEQLKCYWEESLLPQNENPCKWWVDNVGLFPALKNLALKYLPIPASERVFSTAGNMCTSLRE